jgi:lipoate-protein ligase B
MDDATQVRPMALLTLGRRAYDPVHALQLELVERVYQGTMPETLVLVEHDPVITLGRRADESNILATEAVLRREGIAVRRSERGGDVTYHGPGQWVGYPIIRLHERGLGASDYMHRLEDMVAAVVESYGLATTRRREAIGVWVGEDKICALGVRIRRGITFHGFALNVAPKLLHWGLIVPCGITDGGVTSLARELGRAPAMTKVHDRLAAEFARQFGVRLEPVSADAFEWLLSGAD